MISDAPHESSRYIVRGSEGGFGTPFAYYCDSDVEAKQTQAEHSSKTYTCAIEPWPSKKTAGSPHTMAGGEGVGGAGLTPGNPQQKSGAKSDDSTARAASLIKAGPESSAPENATVNLIGHEVYWKVGEFAFTKRAWAEAAKANPAFPELAQLAITEHENAFTIGKFRKPKEPEKPAHVPAVFRSLNPKTAPAPRPWLVPGLLLNRTVTALVGPAGVSKSAFSIHLALAIATGTPFLHWKPVKRKGVLIVASEDDYQEQERRVLAARVALGLPPDAPGDNIIRTLEVKHDIVLVEKNPETRTFQTTGLYSDIEAACTEDVGLVIVDPFIEAASGMNESDNGEVAHVAKLLRGMAQRKNISMLLVHHAGKGKDKDGTQDVARGASSLVGVCRTVVALSSTDKVKDAAGKDVHSPWRFVKVDLVKSNHAPKGMSRWYEKRTVDFGTGQPDDHAPGIWAATELDKGPGWASPYRGDIEYLVGKGRPDGGRYSSSEHSRAEYRLDTALMTRCKVSESTAKDLVKAAEKEKWIVSEEIKVRGNLQNVWIIWTEGTAQRAENMPAGTYPPRDGA